MKKVLFVKNIIPPYRISLFTELQEISENYAANFEVFVMSESEDDRFWKLDTSDAKFQLYSDGKKGFYKFLFKKYHFHFNPNLLKLIKRNQYDVIILGSSWNDFNILILILLKKIGFLKTKIAFWSEANYLTLGAVNDNTIKFFIRKFVLNSCDSFFLIPGQMASKTLFEKWQIKQQKTIFFPNLINDRAFTIQSNILQKRRQNSAPIFLIVARLDEKLKGILNFISNIPLNKKFMIRIAGEGKDRIIYQKFISDNDLDNKIVLLGNLNEHQLISEYKNANAFILPSFSDPSPLSIVEASYMNLPLLVSERCGNHFETITNGYNGLLFDPSNPLDIQDKFNQFLNFGVQKLEDMGKRSYEIIKTTYSSEKVLNNFLKTLCNFLYSTK